MKKLARASFITIILAASSLPAAADSHNRYSGWGHRDCDNESSRPQHFNGNAYGWQNGHLNSGERFDSFYDQRDRTLQNGIRSGELSRDEVAELTARQREIYREVAAYRADGYLSRGEREDLRKDSRDYQKLLQHELNDGEKGRRRW